MIIMEDGSRVMTSVGDTIRCENGASGVLLETTEQEGVLIGLIDVPLHGEERIIMVISPTSPHYRPAALAPSFEGHGFN